MDVVVEAADLLMRTVMRVALQLAEAGDRDAARMQLAACCRLVQRSHDTLPGTMAKREVGYDPLVSPQTLARAQA